VLIVEDDHTLRSLFRSALVVAGYSITAVEDGADALRLIERGALPAVIVLDLMLPRVSGRDVAAELRSKAATRDIPIVVVTRTEAAAGSGLDVSCVVLRTTGLSPFHRRHLSFRKNGPHFESAAPQ